MWSLLFKIRDCQRPVFLEFIAGGQMKLCIGQAQPPDFCSSLTALGDPNIVFDIGTFPSGLF